MARFKATKGKAKPQPTARRAIPCLIVLIGGMLLLSFLFYAMLSSTTTNPK